jgi:hypothetical protein
LAKQSTAQTNAGQPHTGVQKYTARDAEFSLLQLAMHKYIAHLTAERKMLERQGCTELKSDAFDAENHFRYSGRDVIEKTTAV